MSYKLYIVKLDKNLDFSLYDHCFSKAVLEKIYSYRYTIDRLRAFTSALLQYYFLPSVLGIAYTDIIIKKAPNGKPYIENYDQIDFNISHSGEFVLLAVTNGKSIGVDIEKIDENIDLDIGNVVFNESELPYIRNVDDFYLLWTKKEAYLKCIGSGFTSDSYEYTRFNHDFSQAFLSYDINCYRFREKYFLTVCISC